jgi:hypothetical protein
MTEQTVKDAQRERLARLAAFGPRLAKEGIGHWPAAEKQSKNTQQNLPLVVEIKSFPHTPAAEEFYRYCYDDGWVLGIFDWPACANEAEGASYLENVELIKAADLGTLSRLLTVILRQERFNEGGIADSWNRGIIPAILARAAELSEAR